MIDNITILKIIGIAFMLMILLWIAFKDRPLKKTSPNEQIAFEKRSGELKAERAFDYEENRIRSNRKKFKTIANRFGRY